VTDIPPELSSASIELRAISAFMKGVDFGEWRTVRTAMSDTRAWRLARIAATFIAAEYSSGHLPDRNKMLDRAQELMAEAERRIAVQDGVAP
jgi:hypothetical protein